MKDYQKVLVDRVNKNKQLGLDALDWLWKHPQVGYTEWEAHNYLKEKYEALGYELTEAGDIPGFFTDLDTQKPGPTLCIMAELDALDQANHPEAVNGMTHACGHHCQGAALLGLAAALKEPGALDGLSGKIRLMMVPAEEMIQLEYREKLRQEGKIHFFGGKPEFMYRGYFDDVDLCMMVHTSEAQGPKDFSCNRKKNGCIAKTFVFKGKSSHAGGRPDLGVNAEYAFSLALNAVNALRETFKNTDTVRWHPITHGVSSAVNIIPDELSCESYVRANNMDAIKRENEKINRAMTGAALAMGARLELHDRPGYAPEAGDIAFMQVCESCCIDLAGEDRVAFHYDACGTGSSDFGDLTTIMPGCQFYARGAVGEGHGTNYYIADPERACTNSSRVQYLIAYELMKDGAEKAKELVANYKPQFASVKEYLAFTESLFLDKEAVIYDENGNVTIDYKN